MASQRQLMVLRFWNRMDLAQQDSDAISDWLDSWHEASWKNEPALRRLCAWELFKIENPAFADGGEADPAAIPLGAGDAYLKRVAEFEAKYGVDALENLRYGEMPE